MPDDQNFAMAPIVASWYEQIFRRTNGTSRGYRRAKGKLKMSVGLGSFDYPDFGSWRLARRTDLEAWRAYYRSLPAVAHVFAGAPEIQPVAADVLLALGVYAQAIEELHQAVGRPYASSPLVNYGPFMILPHLAEFKNTSRLLQLHAIAELALGRTDEALLDLKVLWRMAEVLRSEPILVSHLLRFVLIDYGLQVIWEGLADHRWNDAELLELEKELARLDLLADYRFAMHGEIVLQQAYFECLRKSPQVLISGRAIELVSGRRIESQRLLTLLLNLIPDGWVYDAQRLSAQIILEWYFPLVDLKTRVVVPSHVIQTNHYTEMYLNKSTSLRILAQFIYFDGAALKRFVECQAAIDLARVAIALERYRLAHGAYPESMDQLVPRFMDLVPHDIVNGRPLEYRIDPERGFILYSVGWNETDDGGSDGLASPGSSEGRTCWERGDLVWRYPAEKAGFALIDRGKRR